MGEKPARVYQSTPQEHLDRLALVHRAVAGGGLVERQLEVQDLARVDLAVPDRVDQLGQEAADGGRGRRAPARGSRTDPSRRLRRRVKPEVDGMETGADA
jgi:hypothetical protein